MGDKKNDKEENKGIENNQKETSNESGAKDNNKLRRNIVIGLLVAVILSGGMIVKGFNDKYINTTVISENVFIEDVDVSNLSKDEAIEKVNEKYSPKNIKLNYKDQEIVIKPKDIDLKINTEEVVNEAYEYTKTDSYFDNVKRVLELRKESKDYDIKTTYNDDNITNILKDTSKKMDIDVKNASVHISDGGGISTTNSVTGRELDIKKSKELINKVIDDGTYKSVKLKVDEIKPRITTEAAKSVNTLLGTHTTKFLVTENSKGRVHNIKLAANKSSDVLLMPGEEFSYNTLTGMRTVGNGYQNAPVIVKGELVEGLGGGVCQVSTTLYNAVLNSGTKVTSVMNHSLKSTYAPPGKDAMVNDGGTDFRFKNSFDHPIYVKNTVVGDTLTCKIYGSSADKKNITIKTEEYVQNGLDAANTYREYRDSNGNVISTEYVDTSVYKKPKEKEESN